MDKERTMTYDVQEVPIARVCAEGRYRPVDDAKARELAMSMAYQGLLQPIGVRPCTCDGTEGPHYRLLFGAHRVQAAAELGWETLAATIFPADLPEAMAHLAELQENSVRNDLTGAQRKAFTAEAGRLLAQLAEDAHLPKGQKNWLMELSSALIGFQGLMLLRCPRSATHCSGY
jgi:ParB/RepB/Spo0J family partition protein